MKIKCFALLAVGLLRSFANQRRSKQIHSRANGVSRSTARTPASTNIGSTQKLPDKIQLPGILEAQGYGDEISTTHAVGAVALRSFLVFAGGVRRLHERRQRQSAVPLPAARVIMSARRGISATSRFQKNGSGKRVVLFLERPHWKSTVWLDDKEIGSDISLCVPHEYDFGIMPPGKHRLTVRVDNRMIMPYRLDAHSVSDSLDDAWNGIIGKIELRATPPVWIEDVRVFPNLETKTITVKARNRKSNRPSEIEQPNHALVGTELSGRIASCRAPLINMDFMSNWELTERILNVTCSSLREFKCGMNFTPQVLD